MISLGPYHACVDYSDERGRIPTPLISYNVDRDSCLKQKIFNFFCHNFVALQDSKSRIYPHPPKNYFNTMEHIKQLYNCYSVPFFGVGDNQYIPLLLGKSHPFPTYTCLAGAWTILHNVTEYREPILG